MAIVIFNKQDKIFLKAFDTQSLVDEYGYNNPTCIAQSISDSEWTNMKNGTLIPASINTDTNTINWVNRDTFEESEESLKEQVDKIIKILKQVKKSRKNGHSQETKFNDYLTALENLNYSNITFPMTTSIEQYMESLGVSTVYTHEIP